MCFDAKSSATGFWITAFLSLMIWYRNQTYDRALAIFILFLGLVQLVEFTIHSGASGAESAKWIFMILILQTVVLSFGVYMFTTGWVNAIALALFIGSLLLFSYGAYLTSTQKFDAWVGPSGHIIWSRNGDNLMGSVLGPLYLIGLFLPLILLWIQYGLANLSPLVLIVYGAVSAVYVMANYPSQSFSSMWCYLAVGFAFLQWFLGMFGCNGNVCS